MNKITEKIVEKEDEYVVNGEGCTDDCPHHSSWVSDKIGCGWNNTPFITSKR